MRKFYVYMVAVLVWLAGSQSLAQVPNLSLSTTELDSADGTAILKGRVDDLRSDVIPKIVGTFKMLRKEYSVNFQTPPSLKTKLSGQLTANISVNLNSSTGDTLISVRIPALKSATTGSQSKGKTADTEEEDVDALFAICWLTKGFQRFYAEVTPDQKVYAVYLMAKAGDSLLVAHYTDEIGLPYSGTTPLDNQTFAQIIAAITDSSVGSGEYIKLSTSSVQRVKFTPDLEKIWTKAIKEAGWTTFRRLEEGEEKTFIQR